MKLQTRVVQKSWSIPSTGELEIFQNEVNDVLSTITDEDDLVNLEFHTTQHNGHGVSTAYITFWEYDFDEEDFDMDDLLDDDDDLDEDEMEEEEEMEEEIEENDEEEAASHQEIPMAGDADPKP